MIDKTIATILNGSVVDHMARDIIPTTIGVSTGVGTIIHLEDATMPSLQTAAQNMLDNFGGLTVNADKTTMAEGDADPVITISTADVSLGYVVLLDGTSYASGSENAVGGVVTLNLISPIAGVYQVFAYRKTGDYSSGSVTITVNEA